MNKSPQINVNFSPHIDLASIISVQQKKIFVVFFGPTISDVFWLLLYLKLAKLWLSSIS